MLDECGVLRHEVHYMAKSQWAITPETLLLQQPPRRFWSTSVGVCAHSAKEHLLGQTLMLDTEAWLRIILITPRNVFTADILTGQVGKAQVEFLTLIIASFHFVELLPGLWCCARSLPDMAYWGT